MNNPPGKSAFGLDANVAAGLAYVPFFFCHLIVSIGILATDKTNKLARFHAVQSLLLSGASVVLSILFFICYFVVFFVVIAAQAPALIFLVFLVFAVFGLLMLGLFIGLIIAMIKGFQGEIFRLPVLGNFADKWSN